MMNTRFNLKSSVTYCLWVRQHRASATTFSLSQLLLYFTFSLLLSGLLQKYLPTSFLPLHLCFLSPRVTYLERQLSISTVVTFLMPDWNMTLSYKLSVTSYCPRDKAPVCLTRPPTIHALTPLSELRITVITKACFKFLQTYTLAHTQAYTRRHICAHTYIYTHPSIPHISTYMHMPHTCTHTAHICTQHTCTPIYAHAHTEAMRVYAFIHTHGFCSF